MITLTWETRKFEEISLPPPALVRHWQEIYPEYAVNKTEISDKRLLSLSRKAAFFLAATHPMIIWGRKNYCIGGLRTLMLVSPLLRIGDILPVGVLPDVTSLEKIKEILETDILVSGLSYSLRNPPAAIYGLAKKIPKDRVAKLSPALAKNNKCCAELFDCSVPTLYKVEKGLK